jgi:putative Holliday junction resolvase
MRFMGIDYGTKRVGIALSDESNTFALPKTVIENSKSLLESIDSIARDNNVTHIVLGESKNYKGEDNKIMPKIQELKEKIENNLKLPVVLEPEFMTSHNAERFQGKTELLDASAAALILQSYLDRLNSQGGEEYHD